MLPRRALLLAVCCLGLLPLSTPAQPTYLQAKHINAVVNNKVSYQTDLETYGVPEFWNYPVESEHGVLVGDCEDYVLAKRKMFIDLGFADYVRIASAVVPVVGYHAVLVVSTTTGDYVLDSNHALPMRKQELDWKWDRILERGKWLSIL